MDELLTLLAKKTKPIDELITELTKLGFVATEYSIEKTKSMDVHGKKLIDFKIQFFDEKIEIRYTLPPNKSSNGYFLEQLPHFLDILVLCENYYEIKFSELYRKLRFVSEELIKASDSEIMELSTRLSDKTQKHDLLVSKYEELVKSSELNARLLLECEHQRDELRQQLQKYTKITNEQLKELLFNWLKVRSGKINIKEFAQTNMIPESRIEEGLNYLITEGYIRRRND